MSGTYIRTPEIREKQRQSALGRTVSDETKQKLSVAFRGRKQSPEHIAARSKALKGRKSWNKGRPLPGIGHPTSDATRAKLSMGMRGANNPRYQPDRDLVAARLTTARFMRECLRRLRVNKNSTSAKMLGYDKNALPRHIEAQFSDGMNWGNYGSVWEIDHVCPVAKYVLAGVADPKTINALTNLRPLWVSENRSKRDKMILERRASI